MAKPTIYSPCEVDKFISRLVDLGYECYNVNEGVCSSGDWICVAPDDTKYNFVIKDVYLNEWSSGQTIRKYNRLSAKQLSLIDELLDKED